MSTSKLALLGGAPVRTKPFPARRTMGLEERNLVMEVLESDCLSAFIGAAGPMFLGGEKVRAFERKWSEQYGFPHAISVNSWSSGLQIAYGAIGLGPGDEVIVPPYTMSASATSAFFYGGIPVFADIDETTFCISPAAIEAAVTPRTRAIMVVHLFGHAADMDGILAVANRHGLSVIEDAAQAPGVLFRGKPVGAIGDVGGFSLNFHKHIHTGEGGMLVTRSEDIARRCQLIRNHGENAIEGPSAPPDIVNAVGGNFRLTELQAAIGIAQLARLEGYLAHRRTLARAFRKRLEGVPGVVPQPEPSDPREHAYYVFPIRYDAEVVGLSRDAFVKAVTAELPSARDVESVPLTQGYVRPLYLNRVYQEKIAIGSKGFPWSANPSVEYRYPKGLCPVAERMHERELLLTALLREPLTEEDVLDLANAIIKVVERAADLRNA